MKKIRCAIYTRKSAEEGLEQEFNSLDACVFRGNAIADSDVRRSGIPSQGDR